MQINVQFSGKSNDFMGSNAPAAMLLGQRNEKNKIRLHLGVCLLHVVHTYAAWIV